MDRSKKRAGRRSPYASLLLGALALVIHLIPAAGTLLEYNRSGDTWRLITCHFTHFSQEHLLWDLLAFMVLGAMCEKMDRGRYLLCVGVSTAFISTAVWTALPCMTIYRGLSGLDSALFGLLAARLWLERRNYRWLIGAFALLFAGKIGYELFTQSAFFVSSFNALVRPVPLAHAAGAAAGVVIALIPLNQFPFGSVDQRAPLMYLFPSSEWKGRSAP
jgi:rhomboid family GlyGly-CTERM serine protease